MYTTSLNATYLEPSPECTIGSSKCTALWQSYLGEQGMPTTIENATEPAITPMPTERPRCSLGNVTQICETLPKPSCVFSAQRVDLYVSSLCSVNPIMALTSERALPCVSWMFPALHAPAICFVYNAMRVKSERTLIDNSHSTGLKSQQRPTPPLPTPVRLPRK